MPISFQDAEERLLAAGSPFALSEEEVQGERMQVYAQRAQSLRELLARSRAHGDAEYLVFDDGRRLTFAEHADAVASVAAGLRERFGIGKGDRVAILAGNCPEWILSYWATTSLGAVVVGMNGWWAKDEIGYGIELSEPALLVADERRLARLGGDDPGVPVLRVESDFGSLWRDATATPLPDVPLDEDDPAVLLFTSGTTGRPKGVLLSHRSIIAYVMTSFFLGARRALTEPPTGTPGALLAPFPLFHVSGLLGSTTAALAGSQKTVWPTGRFDAGKVIRLTQQEGVTSWVGATTHVFRLLDHPDMDTVDRSRFTNVGVGGSATTPELIRSMEQHFPHLAGSIGSGYGSTESGGLISYANNAMLLEAPGCVGPPLPTVRVKIVDEDDAELPEGSEGHIAAQSPLLMLGYWRNPEADAETLLPGRWLKTGDVGKLENGRLYLASRKRDLILRGGENIYPIEIESRLEEHPDVAEVAVVGVAHRELGQEVKAIVVPRPGASPDPLALMAFVGETLAYFKVPTYVELRGEPLPRNASGKVMKHVLLGEGDNTFVEE